MLSGNDDELRRKSERFIEAINIGMSTPGWVTHLEVGFALESAFPEAATLRLDNEDAFLALIAYLMAEMCESVETGKLLPDWENRLVGSVLNYRNGGYLQ